jgi:hypothetical protein
MKHKHADLIHAWADGAKIQWRDPKDDERWSDITIPNWLEDCEYRIKPEPKHDVIRNFYLESNPLLGLRFSQAHTPTDLRGREFGCIRCTFDFETGKLKSAEVL